MYGVNLQRLFISRSMVFEREELRPCSPFFHRSFPAAYRPGQRMRHGTTACPCFDHAGARPDSKFVRDEADVGEIDDLRSVWQG